MSDPTVEGDPSGGAIGASIYKDGKLLGKPNVVSALVRYQRYDKARPCPACGEVGSQDTFCTSVMPPMAFGWRTATVHLTSGFREPTAEGIHGKAIVPDGEHLHRVCNHCSRPWIEVALDAEEISDDEWLIAYEEIHSTWHEGLARYIENQAAVNESRRLRREAMEAGKWWQFWK